MIHSHSIIIDRLSRIIFSNIDQLYSLHIALSRESLLCVAATADRIAHIAVAIISPPLTINIRFSLYSFSSIPMLSSAILVLFLVVLILLFVLLCQQQQQQPLHLPFLASSWHRTDILLLYEIDVSIVRRRCRLVGRLAVRRPKEAGYCSTGSRVMSIYADVSRVT